MRWTTVKGIANDWLTEMEYRGKTKPDIIYRYAHNAAEMLIGSESLSYQVALIDVENLQGKVPKNFHSETLVACIDNIQHEINRGRITSYTKDVFGTDCQIEVNLLCPECHEEKCSCATPVIEIDIDDVYLNTHPHLKQISNQNMIGWAAVQDDGFPTKSPFFGFEIMRPKVSNEILWNMEFYLGECEHQNLEGRYSYQIDGDTFTTDLKEGKVVIAYLAYKKDADGYYMIPDNVWAVEAIKSWITYSFKWKEYIMHGNQGDRLKWKDAENKALSEIQNAKSKMELPTAAKWYRIMSERWVVPRDNYYY